MNYLESPSKIKIKNLFFNAFPQEKSKEEEIKKEKKVQKEIVNNLKEVKKNDLKRRKEIEKTKLFNEKENLINESKIKNKNKYKINQSNNDINFGY